MDTKPIRVLIAEDSELFAQVIIELLERDRLFEVFGVAKDGFEAVRMTELGKPDVVLMDVRMPGMDGLSAVERIMERCPTPILVMTSDPKGHTGELSFEALRRGAIDLVPKPATWSGTPAEQEELRARLRSTASVRVVRRRVERPVLPSFRPSKFSLRTGPSGAAPRVVGLVASTGGPPVLSRILSALPEDFPFAIVIVQHLSDGFAERFASWLDQTTAMRVEVAREGSRVEAGSVLVASSGAHIKFHGRLSVTLDLGAPVAGHRPSGSVMLSSLARTFGRRALAGVLTGMGSDGASGLLDVQRGHGLTFVQSAQSSVVAGMPEAARALGAAECAWSPEEIANELLRLARPWLDGGRPT